MWGCSFLSLLGVKLFQDCSASLWLDEDGRRPAGKALSLGFHQVFLRQTLPPGSAAHCWWNTFVKVASVFGRLLIHFLLGIKNKKKILPLTAFYLSLGRATA